MVLDNSTLGNDNSSTTLAPSVTTSIPGNFTAISTMNMTDINSTIIPSTPKPAGNETSEDEEIPKPKMSSAAPQTTPKSKKATTTTKANLKNTITTAKPQENTSDSTGIIILVVIIIVALGFGVACYCARNRRRRYSVDFTTRQEDANIPLSTVDPEMPGDPSPQNGLTTFESAETVTKEPEEPETKPEVQEEQKAEPDKSVDDPSAESAAPAPTPDSSEDKPKEDAVEQSPPAPAEPSVEEKTDDEGGVSNKTSVESLKETNENNSNNINQQRDLTLSNLFWDVPLGCPV